MVSKPTGFESMQTSLIICFLAVSFLLGFIKPMFSSQAHTLISLGTYLFMWIVLNTFEKRRKIPYSNVPHVIFWLIVVVGALTFLADLAPTLSQPVLIVRAFVFIVALVYLLSSTAQMYVDVWLARLKAKREI